jgi:hypothetical protein
MMFLNVHTSVISAANILSCMRPYVLHMLVFPCAWQRHASTARVHAHSTVDSKTFEACSATCAYELPDV